MKTAVQDTSIEAYHQLKASGDEMCHRMMVFGVFVEAGYTRDFTRNELCEHFATLKYKPLSKESSMSGRVNELLEAGVIEVKRTRMCSVSGRRNQALGLALPEPPKRQGSLF